MGKSNDREDPRSRSWPWNDQTFQNMQADHEHFMNQLREDGRRLQRHLENELTPHSPDSSGPFSTFKKFIDDNLNTLTEGFRNFPANLAEVRARMQQEQERRREEEADISRRWTGSSDSPDHIRMEFERSSQEERNAVREASLLLIQESWRRNRHIPTEKILALFADPQSRFGDLDRFASPMLSWGGACYYKPESGDNLPSTRTWNWTCGPTPRWLSVDWFKRSPYSPVRLEAHPEAGLQGSMWREAFEDLLNASLDKPMESHESIGQREPYGQVHSTLHGPGLDWMLSLQCRGILPPQLPRLYNSLRGTRQAHQKSIADFLAHGASSAPWSTDASFSFHSPIEQDFSELMSVVGIKATPDEAAPRTQIAYQTPHPARAETELDLYDTYPHSVRNDGLIEEFLTALEEDDEVALIDVFHRWSQINPDLRGLLQPVWTQCVHWSDLDSEDSMAVISMLTKALHQLHPSVTENEHNKAIADLLERFKEIQEGTLGDIKQRRYYLKLLDSILFGDHHRDTAWMTETELKEWVERLEQEAINLAEMTGERERKPEVAVTEQPTSPAPPKKPDVLSALTTTHTTRSPDGTVTTKVVLKQRFADGREETHESVHTEHKSITEEPEEQPKKRGWFWS